MVESEAAIISQTFCLPELVSDAAMLPSEKNRNTFATRTLRVVKGHTAHHTNQNKLLVRIGESAVASLAHLRLLDLPLVPKLFSCCDSATCFFLGSTPGQTALLYKRRKFSCSHLETVPRTDPPETQKLAAATKVQPYCTYDVIGRWKLHFLVEGERAVRKRERR